MTLEWVFLGLALRSVVVKTSAVLRYESLGGDSLKFCLNVPIKIGVSSTPPVQAYKAAVLSASCRSWCNSTTVPQACADSPPTSLAYYECNRPGNFVFGDSITIPVDFCQDRYRWYVQPVTNDTSGNTTVDRVWAGDVLAVRVWVLYKDKQTTAETAGTAVVTNPGADSFQLTKNFQQMGLRPYLLTYFPDQTDIFYYCAKNDVATYNLQQAFWEFRCHQTTNDRYGTLNGTTASGKQSYAAGLMVVRLTLNITARYSVSVCTKGAPMPTVEITYQQKFRIMSNGTYDMMGFTVADAYRTFSRPKFALAQSATGVSLTADTNLVASAPVVRFEPCNPSTAVVYCQNCALGGGNGFIITQDEFLSVAPFTPTLVSSSPGETVLSFVVTEEYILLLTNQRLYALGRNETTWNARPITLPPGSWKGINAAEWCTTGSQGNDRDTVIIYSANSLLLGRRNGGDYQFVQTTVPASQILEAALDPVLPLSQLLVLRDDGGSTSMYVEIIKCPDVGTQSWPYAPQQRLTASVAAGGPVQMRPMSAGDLSVLVATASRLIRIDSATTSVTFNNVDIAGVKQIFTTETGHRYYQDSGGSIYHGVAGDVTTVKLYTSASSGSFIWIDRFQRPVLESITNGNTVQKQNLDLGIEILNGNPSAILNPVCPFALFVVNGSERWYQIDSSETYYLSAELWAPIVANQADVTLKFISRSAPLPNSLDAVPDIRQYRQVKRYGDMVKSSLLITVTNTYSLEPKSKLMLPQSNPKQVTSLTILPSLTSPVCTQQLQSLTFVQISCPVGITIGLIPQYPCSTAYPSTLQVPRQYLYNIGNAQPFTVASNLPCDSPYYGDPYKPKFGLYYFNQLLEEVPVDYILFDVNWRKDYSYNATEIDEGCTIAAANIQSMSSNYQKTPMDGRVPTKGTRGMTCFNNISTATPASASRAYEIMNSTNDNFMFFSKNHSAVFVFVAMVVDSNYSFCDLQAKFVVMPYGYGDMPDPMIPVYAWIASICACVIFYWVVYLVYSVSWNENRVGFDMMQKTPQPAAWHLLTDGERELIHDGTLDAQRTRLYVPKDVLEAKKDL